MAKNPVKRELSDSETLIMKVVWDAKGDIALRDVIERLKTQYGKEYARTTVVTFLGKMAEKGFVSTYRIGKTSFVHAERDEESYKRELMKMDTDFWFGGKPLRALSAICESREISQEEIDEMRTLLDELDD
jgi:predicted transcriptional regulator